MYAAYHLRADELNDEVVQTLKNTFRQDEIVILPKAAYDEIEKIRHNAAFTEKLQLGIRDIDEGRGIVKTMDELKAMEDECSHFYPAAGQRGMLFSCGTF